MFVNRWKSAPFLRLLLPLVAGIIAGLYRPAVPWFILGICAAGWVLPAWLPVAWRFRLRYLRGMCVAGTVFCLGCGLMYMHDIRHQPDWFGHVLKDTAMLVVVLQETPVKKPNSWKAEAAVRYCEGRPATGKLILYFREAPALHYGQRLMLRANVQSVRGTGNPGAFDYARYCSYRGLFHQVFLQQANWQKLPGNENALLAQWLMTARDYCLNTLKTHIPRREEYGVAQALLIGYRNELDADIVQAYTNTGVVHIIAISGLHLGLIYMSLLQLLRWLPAGRAGNAGKAMLLISVLWGFSLLTGASASVLRSAVMFTTIAAGQLLINRHSSIFNTLAAAAFLLLCYNPYFLLDAGFQLSFLAVAGILVCYKPLYDAWPVRNAWLDKLWQMVAVSLAAQVFTWPVCLFYFRQFPNYFLLANMVAVPLSTLVLYGEILLVIFPWCGAYAGPALQWGIRGMNVIIQWIDGLPGAVTQNIHTGFAQMWCLYGLTIAGCVWWLLRRKKACWWLLSAGVAFAGLEAAYHIRHQNAGRLIVYNVPRKTMVECIDRRESLLLGDTMAATAKYTAPAHLLFGVRTMVARPYTRGLFCCKGKQVLLWEGRLPRLPPADKIRVHYIILSKGAPEDIHRFGEFFIYEKIIFDSSCPPFLLRKWKSAGNKLPLRCFSVPDKGAFVVNL